MIKTIFKLMQQVSTVLMAALVLIACSPSGPVQRAWTEDVLLEDGSTIVVKRTVSFNETNSWSGDAYNAVETDATISFTGELAGLQPWRAPLMALVMYRDKATNEWVVVATTTSGDLWRQRGKPCPIYWEYRLNQQSWREVPLSAVSIGRPVNLLHRYQDKLKSDHISISDREALESDQMIGKEFKRVVTKEKSDCGK